MCSALTLQNRLAVAQATCPRPELAPLIVSNWSREGILTNPLTLRRWLDYKLLRSEENCVPRELRPKRTVDGWGAILRSRLAGRRQVCGLGNGERLNMTEVKWVTVVDDDAAVRETVRAWLICRGGWYRVRSEYALAEDAVAALPVERPDIIVLDVRMGTMDGLECLHHLRPLLPATRIILHTAFGDADVLHHALTGGANG